MKKVISLLCIALAAQVFSAEQICAPNFEVVGLNPDFGKSSIKTLQGKMEAKMHARQLLIPAAEDSVAVTDGEEHQIAWARSRGCQYLLQTTLTRLGETVQASVRLMDLNSNGYSFKKAYKASSPDELHPIFQQLGNTLQEPKFASVETIYDVTASDAKALTKKRTTSYYQGSLGAGYYAKIEEVISFGAAYSWDNRTIVAEGVANFKFNPSNSNNGLFEAGIRIMYPFSEQDASPYVGGGISYVASVWGESYNYSDYGYSYTYRDTKGGSGLLLEAAGGYFIGRTSGLIIRFEAYGDVLFQGKDKNFIGGGARMILGIVD